MADSMRFNIASLAGEASVSRWRAYGSFNAVAK